jgi:peroxiredoxin Q/BCP
MAILSVGDAAPDFELLDQNNNKVSLSTYSGQKLLIFFYPKANTPGCTTQSCSVRDAIPDLAGLNMAAVGISPDQPDKQLNFDEKYSLGFPLLSDPEHEVAEAYGAWGEKKNYGKTYMGIIRSSFLVDEQGKIAQAAYKVKPGDTVPKAKAAVVTV